MQNDNTKKTSLLDVYLTQHFDSFDMEDKAFQNYCSIANRILENCNWLIFPKEKIVEKNSSDEVIDCKYLCDLVVGDGNFGCGLITKEVTVSQKSHLQNFELLRQFIQLQEPKATIEPITKKEKDLLCEYVRLGLLAGFETVFNLKTGFKVQRIGFDEEGTEFIFNNGKLDIKSGEFEQQQFTLTQDSSISLSYPSDTIEGLQLNDCLSNCISLEKYVSSEKTIAAITIGYLICGIFRKEYQKLHNEYPFLGFEGYSGIGKTSLLNFLSRVVGYNWNSINGVCDSEYAFEVNMNSLGGWFYFVDEIQKISSKLQRYIQAAYNSGENHKGGANGNWQDIQTYRKDCSLIAAGEILPQQEEALLNRFIICCPKLPFAVKKQVTDCEEFIKFMELSGIDTSNNKYLNTDEIKYLAVNYYKPRFMFLLKHKNQINFQKFHNEAVALIEKYAGSSIDTRHKNNLICPLTGYLILRQGNIDENEVKEIVTDYFAKLQTYRKHSIISGVIVDYVLENIAEFGSWMGRVKGTSQTGPMIWIKYSEKEQGMILQIDNIIRYCKNKIENKLSNKHSKQQLVQLLGVKDIQGGVIKFAKGTRNIAGTFIPLSVVEGNEFLKKIWDTTLSYQHGHVEELRHVLQGEDVELSAYKQSIQKVMPSEILEKLCEELECTSEKAQYFDESFREISEDSRPF